MATNDYTLRSNTGLPNIGDNPYLKTTSHPFSALFDLLPKLESGQKAGESHYSFVCETNILEAISRHIENLSFSINSGIEAIGTLQANTEDNEVNSQTIKDIGWLIKTLADLQSSYTTLQTDITYELIERYTKPLRDELNSRRVKHG